MIRKLSQAEIPLIAKEYEKVMKNHFKKVGEDFITKEKYETILKDNFDNSLMFVLDDLRIKGFLWFMIEDDEISLEELFVIEEKKGYGKTLMDYLIDYARKNNIKRINMDVHFRNKKALIFFKKFGFTERTIELSLDF